MARFCWRERSERLNWRLLRGLELAEVVRRGDATLLEPYALHLTFARLPVVVASLGASADDGDDGAAWPRHDDERSRGHARNAWFVARVFQLSMEYLLFLRARDGTVVDSLREELLVCERECELLVERARKWKDRSRSAERQVEKLHQVLQNVAKLLQIEGATPSAVSTIESLLRGLEVPKGKRDDEPSVPQVDEARVCALCGKIFSSQAFLEKHAIRRHPGAETTTIHGARKPSSSGYAKTATEGVPGNQGDARTDHPDDMKAMLRAVEETLQEHQTALRTVAQQEADKLHNLYEQLHVETQLAEEMRSKRIAVEKEVEARQRELDAIEQEKEDVSEEVRVMKEQLEFLAMKRRIETQNGGPLPSTAHPGDPTMQLEINRLEETVTMLRDALSDAREELQRTHEAYGALLKEKMSLESDLHEAKNHTSRLESSLRGAQEQVPPRRLDVATQAFVATSDSTAQTDEIPHTEQAPEAVVVPPLRITAGEAAVQTEEPDRAERTDSMMQTDPDEATSPSEPPRKRSPTASIGVGVSADLMGDEDLDSVFQTNCESILDTVQRRAHRSAFTNATTTVDQQRDEKIFSSLSRRRYLRSRFLHEESAVSERIVSHVGKLEQTSLRYGVSPKSSVLANEHVEVVQRALHAHLEVLPSEVLQRMIDVENSVNKLIQQHWMPQEKSRQQALERLTAGVEAKSQANQGLVRQAMLAFGSAGSMDPHPESVLSKANLEDNRLATTDDVDASEEAKEPSSEIPSILVSNDGSGSLRPTEDDGAFDGKGKPSVQLPAPDLFQGDELLSSAAQEHEALSIKRPEPARNPSMSVPEASASQQQGEPSPVTVQEVRRQTVAERSVQVISVSPKSSPPKPPPRMPTQTNAAHENETERNSVTEEIALPREDPVFNSKPTGDEIAGLGASDTASSAAATALPTQPVQPSGTSVMHSGAPSSFSAKHPESQLGIVIPSRYDPNTITVHGLQNDPDGDSFGDYRPRHELRWSSSVGGSGGASERSFSAVESSEMSFDASIPSLGSEGVSVSRSFPRSSTEQLPQVPPTSEPLNIPDAIAADDANEIPRIDESTIEETSEAEEDAVQAMAPEQTATPAPEPQRSPRLSPRPNEVLAFSNDDDSDIEEVVLA